MPELERTIFITHTDTYDDAVLLEAVRRHFSRFGMEKRVGPGSRVLLKPNLLMKSRPETATTTHPALVKAVALCLKELGVTDIMIADSPGGGYSRALLAPVYEACGMRAAAEEAGACLYDACETFERKAPDAVLVKSFTLIQAVEGADFIIDLPKLKTHGMMTLSGAVKNLFGTVPGLMKPELHWRFPEKEPFAQMLLDLCGAVKPDFVLCDGVVAMEGDGPSGGSPRATGMLLSSVSPYAMDVVLCAVVGLSPWDVPTAAGAIKRGLCPENLEELSLEGDALKRYPDFQMPRSKSVNFSDHIPRPFRKAADRLLISRPVIQKSRCVGCGKCAESCPPKTIRIVERKARIDSTRCIHCFCCHEMCPVRAIRIRRLGLFNL